MTPSEGPPTRPAEEFGGQGSLSVMRTDVCTTEASLLRDRDQRKGSGQEVAAVICS